MTKRQRNQAFQPKPFDKTEQHVSETPPSTTFASHPWWWRDSRATKADEIQQATSHERQRLANHEPRTTLACTALEHDARLHTLARTHHLCRSASNDHAHTHTRALHCSHILSKATRDNDREEAERFKDTEGESSAEEERERTTEERERREGENPSEKRG